MRNQFDRTSWILFLGRLALVLCVGAPLANTQAVDPIPVHFWRPRSIPFINIPLKQLCGHLNSENGSYKGSVIVPVIAAELRLFEFNSQQQCCKGLKLLSIAATGEDGIFDFGDIPLGEYWLTFTWQGREYAAIVDVDPRHEWPGKCQDQNLIINEKYHDIGRLLQGTVD